MWPQYPPLHPSLHILFLSLPPLCFPSVFPFSLFSLPLISPSVSLSLSLFLSLSLSLSLSLCLSLSFSLCVSVPLSLSFSLSVSLSISLSLSPPLVQQYDILNCVVYSPCLHGD